MLNLEYLLEEAESNGLPIIKKRGILREYLQVIALNSIYKTAYGKIMFFTGGTALRFFYNMPRFSENLHFYTSGMEFEQFNEVLKHAKKGLEKEGFNPRIYSEKRNNLYVGELHFKDIMNLYNITDKRGLDLMIKIEAYKPPWELHQETGVLSLYGYNFSSVLLHRKDMFSEKLLALFSRKRGRDVYDTLFMLKKRFPFSENVLAAAGIKVSPKGAILHFLENIPEKELKFLADQVKPFLFKEDDIELVLNAPLYAKRFLGEYEGI